MDIRAVIFDIGGVLFRMSDYGAWRKWEVRLGLAEKQLGEIVFGNPISHQAFVGKSTAADAWNEARRRLGLTPEELKILQADFWKGGIWDTELLAFIRSLRPEHRTAVISDAWSDVRQATRDYINDVTFDVIVFSFEEGLAKPDPKIYQRALSRLDVAASEAIFVDDRPKNIQGALQIGLHAIQFKDSQQVRGEIERFIQRRSP
jgi:putative hydrolase of the HAD superfamily